MRFKNTNERKNSAFLFQGWKIFFLVFVFFVQNFSAQIFVSKETSMFFGKESEVFAPEIEASEGSEIIDEKNQNINNSTFHKVVKNTSKKKTTNVFSSKKAIVKKTIEEPKKNNVFVFSSHASKDNIVSSSCKQAMFVSPTNNNFKDLGAFMEISKKKNYFSLRKSKVLFSYENSRIILVSRTRFWVRPPPTSRTI